MTWFALALWFLIGVPFHHADAQFYPLGLKGQAAAGGCSQATTFLARTSGENTSALTTLICGMVTDGVINGNLTTTGCGTGGTFPDRIFIHAMANSTDALLDVCGGTSATNHSATFTANQGFTGVAASTTVWVDSGFNGVTATSPNYALNQASIATWVLGGTLPTVTNSPIGARDASAATSRIFPSYSDGKTYCSINDGENDTGTPLGSSSDGLFMCIRTSSSISKVYFNGTLLSSPNQPSISIPNITFGIVATNAITTGVERGWGTPVGMTIIGGDLTSVQGNIHTRGCTYLTAVHGSC